MNRASQLGFHFLVQALSHDVRGGLAVAKIKVDGKVLKVVNAITGESEDELNNRRFSRLCSMLRSQELVWRTLREHDKEQIIRDAKQRLGNQAFA